MLGNEEEFAKLYEKYSEEIPKKDKKKVNAYQLLDLILFERSFTGRVYLIFADNMYKGSWKNPVYNSNLCCFEGDTPIITDKGIKKIKDICKDDYVLSYNEKTKKNEYKRVVATKNNGLKEIIKLTIGNKKLLLTPDHKIFTKNRGYVEAQHLNENDDIIINEDF